MQQYATQLNQSQEPSLPSQVPILPLGGEKHVVKFLAQGHKFHDRESNSHSRETPELVFVALVHSATTPHF